MIDIFEKFRKINGSLTQKQVDSINKIINLVPTVILQEAVGLEVDTTMKISNTGLKLIQEFEGFKTNAYDDGVGVWTIGYGTIRYPNGTKVEKGDVCTKEQAEIYMQNDLTSFEKTINDTVKVKISQNQYDSLLSLCYNIGSGAFSKSTLLKKLNSNDFVGASDQFLVWNKAGGKVMQGLSNRREKERALFLK